MKSFKPFLIVLVSFFFCFSMKAGNPFAGLWKGNLNVMGTTLALVIHISENDDTNTLRATMDSPDQDAFGIPAGEVTIDNHTITIPFPSIQGHYKGQMEKDMLIGTFTQMGQPFNLNLVRFDEVQDEPIKVESKPLAFEAKEVTVKSYDGYELKGTLATPKKSQLFKPKTLVLLLTGSGVQDRDESILKHKPFADIANAMAAEGIATLRFDDRGYGTNDPASVKYTMSELLKDAEALLAYAQSLNEYASTGVLGHSEGGVVAQHLAVMEEHRPDFLVMLAAPTVEFIDVLRYQQALLFEGQANGAQVIDEYNKAMELLMDSSLSPEVQRSEVELHLKKSLKLLGLPDLAISSTIDQMVDAFIDPHIVSMLNYKVVEKLNKIDIPVLAIFAEKDQQVEPKMNKSALERLWDQRKPAHSKVVVLEGLNHLMVPAETGSVSEYTKLKPGTSPEVTKTIVTWLRSIH